MLTSIVPSRLTEKIVGKAGRSPVTLLPDPKDRTLTKIHGIFGPEPLQTDIRKTFWGRIT